MLNTPDSVANLNGVADNILILEDDVKAGNEIAEEVLRAKTDCQAGHPCKRSGWQGADPEFWERRQNGHGPDNLAARAE